MSGTTSGTDKLVSLTFEELESIREEAREEGRRAAAPSGELFTAEEMLAIREQYEERTLAEQHRREELEWKIRLELARAREGEVAARKAANDMSALASSLELLLDGPPQPARAQTPPPVRAQSQTPVPAAPRPTTPFGSETHRDAFRRAMAGRKLSVA